MQFTSPSAVQELRINMAPRVFYCEPEWSWQPVGMPDYDFWYVMDGLGRMSIHGECVPLHAGTCFLWRPGDSPRGEQDPAHRLVVFACHFQPLDANGNEVPLPTVPYPHLVQDTNFFAASAHRAERLWRRGDEFGRQQATQVLIGMLWQLWDEVSFPAEPQDLLIENVAVALRRAPSRRWSLDEMAGLCHLSRAQFTRRFRAIYGTSPANYLIQLRLENARQLLTETELTLDQIAVQLGYRDAYFFSRQFKQFTGEAPGAIRQRRRG